MMGCYHPLFYHFSPNSSVSSYCMSSSVALICFGQIGTQHLSHDDERDGVYWCLDFLLQRRNWKEWQWCQEWLWMLAVWWMPFWILLVWGYWWREGENRLMRECRHWIFVRIDKDIIRMSSEFLLWILNMKVMRNSGKHLPIKILYYRGRHIDMYTNRPIDGQPLHSDGATRMDSCAKYDSSHKSSRLGDLCEVLMLIWKWSWDPVAECEQTRYWKMGVGCVKYEALSTT